MGGLVGRAMGGMLGGVARQLQQQQQQVRAACVPGPLSGMSQGILRISAEPPSCLTSAGNGPLMQAADLRQQALHAVQGDRRVQAQLGRDISLGPGG